MSLYHGTKRTFKVLRRRSDVEGRADMARTLPEGDPRYATDFLPRGAAGSWWPWPRLCQELRTQELAGVLFPDSSNELRREVPQCLAPKTLSSGRAMFEERAERARDPISRQH